MTEFEIFILIFLRITAFVFVCPLFGRTEIPSTVKIAISLILAYLLLLADITAMYIVPQNLAGFVLICLSEVLRGMAMGFMSTIFFSVFASAGKIIDTKIGFQMSEVFDPLHGVKTTISGNFMTISAFVVFLMLNGHLHLIRILKESFVHAAMGSSFDISDLYILFINAFSIAFLAAVKIALPIIIIILISEAVMGMLIRFIPQMNIFIVGMPLKVLIGIFALFFLIEPLMGAFESIFEQVFTYAGSLY